MFVNLTDRIFFRLSNTCISLPLTSVATQRRNYRIYNSDPNASSGMTPERISLLEAIGFEWSTTDPRHEPWDVRYEALKEFTVRILPTSVVF